MNDDVINLIMLFAENKLSKIENDIAPLIKKYFNKDWTIINEDFYAKNFDLIKRYKKKLEDIESNPSVLNEKGQVKKCLEFCWKESNFNTSDLDIFKYKMDVFSKLVFHSYENKWSENQMNHFKVVSDIFCNYNNYFISYTNHFAQIINGNYIPIYKTLLSKDDYSDDNMSKKNLLAKAFFRFFYMRNLRNGFFDKDSMRISDDISEKVKQNLDKSIALVQLLSKASFEYTEPNWSYDEYKEYVNSRRKFEIDNKFPTGFFALPFFILIEEDPFPINNDLIPDEYEEWIDQIKGELHCDLSCSIDFKKFSDGIDNLIKDIVNVKNQMVHNVPD